MEYDLQVVYKRTSKTRKRWNRRIARHPNVIAESEKEARLMLIKEYNRTKKRVLSIVRIDEPPTAASRQE